MIGAGGSALVSKTKGENYNKTANHYFTTLIYLLVIIGILVSILGMVFVREISYFLGADEIIIEDCVIYGRTLFAFMTFFILQNCFQSFFVVAERPGYGLKVSIISGLVNIALDFIFMYIFHMGVYGAALSTGISQVFGGGMPYIYFLTKKDTVLRVSTAKFDFKMIKNVCINGLSEMVSNFSTSVVNMLYNMQLMKYAGADGVVAYGIIMYISFIFFGTYLGFAVGTAPVIGYHYGANNTKELKSLLKKCIRLIIVTSVLLTAVAEVFSGCLASIFVSYDQGLVRLTTRAIRIFIISYLISGFNIFCSSFFTALQNGVLSTAIAFLRTLLFQIVLIFVLPIIWGIDGIWSAVVFAEIFTLIFSVVFLIVKRKDYKYG